MFFKNKAKQQIDIQIQDLKLYLENNYKDLAIQARKDAIELVEQSYKNKQINEKTYLKYQKQLGEYTEQMKDYNHQKFYRS